MITMLAPHARPSLASALLSAAIFLSAMATVAWAQESFKTPDEAVNALVNAARADDQVGIVEVLGPDGVDIVSSGDPVADAAALKRFLAAYDEKHEITMDGDNKATMVIGHDD